MLIFLCLIVVSQPKENSTFIPPAAANEQEKTPIQFESQILKQIYLQNNYTNNEIVFNRGSPYTEGSQVQTIQSNFQVTTDFGFSCSTGDPTAAIQNAIYSLPHERATPLNIYLSGTFDPVSTITLEDNINFEASKAIIVGNGERSIFETNKSKEYSEIHAQFYIDDCLFTDYVSLHNVTFQGLQFKNSFSSCINAICGADFNGTGWEIVDNLNIYDCEFEGFSNAVFLNSRNSTFANNYFHENANSGILLPYGYDVEIINNTFVSSLDINFDNSTGLFKNPVGLFLFDVFGSSEVSNNRFIQDEFTTGIEILSCRGFLELTENHFIGGEAYLIDAVDRPFLSSGIRFYNNENINDFTYDDGVINCVKIAEIELQQFNG